MVKSIYLCILGPRFDSPSLNIFVYKIKIKINFWLLLKGITNTNTNTKMSRRGIWATWNLVFSTMHIIITQKRILYGDEITWAFPQKQKRRRPLGLDQRKGRATWVWLICHASLGLLCEFCELLWANQIMVQSWQVATSSVLNEEREGLRYISPFPWKMKNVHNINGKLWIMAA